MLAISSNIGLAPFTDVVEPSLLGRAVACPVLLQRHEQPVADVRIVTVGNRAWVWERPKPAGEGPDWRRRDPSGSGFRRSTDSGETGAAALRMAEALDLGLSAQDWLMTDDGAVFLEVNARGSWLFLDGAEHVVVPEIARLLVEGDAHR